MGEDINFMSVEEVEEEISILNMQGFNETEGTFFYKDKKEITYENTMKSLLESTRRKRDNNINSFGNLF